MTTTTLHLTKNEQLWFNQFSDALKEGWDVKEETLDSYETDEDLDIRYRLARFHAYAPLKKLIEEAKSGKPTMQMSLKDIPQEMIPTIMFTIGAKGIAAMMSVLLAKSATDEDIKALAQLSMLRHSILEANASTPSA